MSADATTTAGLPAQWEEEWRRVGVRAVATLKPGLAVAAGSLLNLKTAVSLPVWSLLLECALPAAQTLLACLLLGGFAGSSAHCPPEALCLFSSIW